MNLPAAPDDLAEDGPRYEAIARMLLEGMADGRYPVGTLLPTEAELSEGLGVSRQTVRAAMRQLLEIGAISRRKGIDRTLHIDGREHGRDLGEHNEDERDDDPRLDLKGLGLVARRPQERQERADHMPVAALTRGFLGRGR